MHTHTLTHVQTHTCCTHRHTHTSTRTHAHTHAHAGAGANAIAIITVLTTHTHTHTNTQTRAYTHTHTNIRTHIRTRIAWLGCLWEMFCRSGLSTPSIVFLCLRSAQYHIPSAPLAPPRPTKQKSESTRTVAYATRCQRTKLGAHEHGSLRHSDPTNRCISVAALSWGGAEPVLSATGQNQ